MKQIPKIVSFLLVGIFLLSSLGFTINKMVCLQSGHEKISLTPLKDCCPENKSSLSSFRPFCCDITNIAFHLNDFKTPNNKNIPSAKSLTIAENNTVCKITDSNKAPSVLFFTDLPPPLYGRKLLSFVSVFII